MSQTIDWAVVTGAGSGIGAALARALADRGIGVVLVGRREAHLAAVRDGISGRGPALAVPADVATAHGRQQVHDALAERGGRLRYLVHNAGVGPPSPDFARTDGDALARAFAVNVTAPLTLTQALLPALRRAAPARVLLVGAGIADRAQPGTGVYGITKKALARLFEQMLTDFAHEAAADLPAVALFQPGLVDTEGLRDHLRAAADYGLPHADYLDAALRRGEALAPAQAAEAMARALVDLRPPDYHGRVLRPAELLGG